jgi:hypothetical protein
MSTRPSLAHATEFRLSVARRLILTVLGGLAECGLPLIIARTGEGRKRAKPMACCSAVRVS